MACYAVSNRGRRRGKTTTYPYCSAYHRSDGLVDRRREQPLFAHQRVLPYRAFLPWKKNQHWSSHSNNMMHQSNTHSGFYHHRVSRSLHQPVAQAGSSRTTPVGPPVPHHSNQLVGAVNRDERQGPWQLCHSNQLEQETTTTTTTTNPCLVAKVSPVPACLSNHGNEQNKETLLDARAMLLQTNNQQGQEGHLVSYRDFFAKLDNEHEAAKALLAKDA